MPALLKIQAIAARRRMYQKQVDLARVPIFLVLRARVHAHPQAGLFKRPQKSFLVVDETVAHQSMLPVQLFHGLKKRLNLTVVDFYYLMVFIVDSAVAKL